MTSQMFEKLLSRQITASLQIMRGSAFYQAALQHELTQDSYIAYLRSLTIIYAFMESSAELGMRHVFHKFGPGFTPKLHLIRKDLNSLNAGVGPDLVEPAQLSYELVRQMRLKSTATPMKGLAYLCAIEAIGFDMQQILPALRHKFPSALMHLEAAKPSPQQLIKPFIATLHTEEESESWESLLEAAGEMLAGFKTMVDACYPADRRKRQFLATTLNPEAGLHLITQNEQEIQIAIGIGNRLLDQMPYMSQRYGERARYFIYSDAAWQIHLTHLSYDAMLDQIRWLAKLLSLKGMPTYTVIVKLYELEAELTKNNPAEASRYQKMGAAARFFEEQTRQRLNPIDQDAVAGKAFQSLVPELGESFTHILASTVVDELNGYRGAEQAMKTWLEQTTQLSSGFIQACIGMLKELKPYCNRGENSDSLV